MNRAETAQLLAVMQTYDQRTVGETDVISWHGAVGDLSFTESTAAVVEHYKANTDRIMPAHLRAIVAKARHAAAGEERQHELEARQGFSNDRRGPMPPWFRSMFEQSLAETRASGKYGAKPGPLAKEIDKLADGAA